MSGICEKQLQNATEEDRLIKVGLIKAGTLLTSASFVPPCFWAKCQATRVPRVASPEVYFPSVLGKKLFSFPGEKPSFRIQSSRMLLSLYTVGTTDVVVVVVVVTVIAYLYLYMLK